ncbi:MAG: hypothetical protein HFH64_07250 [Lachnospiraceae bacterium]|nr:hypothetical protein [Lachnospiraceae bacterium]
MPKTLDIIENQIHVGDVKTITYNGGANIRYIELLFCPITKAQFAPSEDKRFVAFSVSDNNLQLPQLCCQMRKNTLRDLIVSLKNVYNKLYDE